MTVIRAMVVAGAASGGIIEQRVIDVPVRRPGNVLVEVRAASVNRADLAVRAGTHINSDASTSPAVVGLDCSGVVLESDADSGLAPGCRSGFRTRGRLRWEQPRCLP
jgi:NADPH:quinone reductase